MQRYWNMKDKEGQGRAVSCKECRDRHKGGEVSGSSADDERLIVTGDVAKLVRRQRAVVERELAQLSELDSCSETSSVVSERQGRFRESGSQTLSARSLEDLYRSGVVVRPSSPLSIRENPWDNVGNQIETPDCTLPTKDTFKDLDLSKLALETNKHLVANSFDCKGTSGKISSKQKGTILDSLDLLKPPSSYQRGVVPKCRKGTHTMWLLQLKEHSSHFTLLLLVKEQYVALVKGDIEVLLESHKELTTEELEHLTSDALASPENQDDDSDGNEGEALLCILLFNTVI
ncbi:unnamed protein product [Timema podura]|uniref:Uncharacterized protein n=1 Tax=Timema podura TaxID=61482 RepID=A0ABN7P320_TIMPD|nr:unnamed protein product [Timema podura]